MGACGGRVRMTGVLALWSMLFIPLFFWPECPCCAEVEPTCSTCASGSPARWEMTVAGVADNTCTLCDNWNGTFELDWHPEDELDPFLPGCFWRNDFFSAQDSQTGPCDEYSTAHWQLSYTTSLATWNLRARLDLVGTDVRKVYALSGTFDCEGPNTFTAANGDQDFGTDCETWPTSITLTPI